MMMPFLNASGRGAALVVLAVLAGCAGQSTEFHRYTLPLADQRAATAEPGVSLPDSAPTVAVSSVRLADYLDGQGVVYQTSDIEVNEAQANLWADSLSAQLTRSLQRTLGDQLKDHRVLGETLAGDRADTGVRVTLSRFQGRYDGMAVLAGQYQLRDAGGSLLYQQPFEIERPLDDDGYPALVRTLAQGWENVGEQIAHEITRQEQMASSTGAYSRSSARSVPATTP
ncbi:ABC-type transport auxiliary lipoprotein family protein [uncultured Kushneria sp.]|uniref:PqiC family protein n=1 Tax=uncultured Kushneria sp. TaxID=905033 RepID=UPI002612177A|nr:ABC-type transport auxiliary lipoprotein family protein [uncultured Kushneria sp.]